MSDTDEYKLKYISEREQADITSVSCDYDHPENKWFGTFPFPYMNGPLHLGHLFTLSKVEMAALYQKLKGKNVLFPFGFHCTGAPIHAMATRISRGDEKAYEIARGSGIPDDMISSFSDPAKWVEYFPKKGMEDLSRYQPHIDWRRSFHTTDMNPYFDSFVRWQFNKLKSLGYIDFGMRNSIYCSEDGQICADHDRSVGEGVVPVKAQLVHSPFNDSLHICWLTNQGEPSVVPDEIEFNNKEDWVVVSIDGIDCLITLQLLRSYASDMEYADVNIKTIRPTINAKATGGPTKHWTWFDRLSGIKVIKNTTEPVASSNVKEVYVPNDLVVSRTGYQCVVKRTEQWYIKYGDPVWQARVKAYVSEHLETFNPVVKEQLLIAVDWLQEWGFSRETGLGTKIPWDPRYVIDSLSDSTIYMAYYTVAHLLHKDLSGKVEGVISPDDITDEFWSSVFYQAVGEKPLAGCRVHESIVDLFRQQFRYWYPVDLRVSGKDLINNHLVMSLYNHIALFGEEYTPKSFFCNGYVTVDKKKMSKSEGNFITVKDAIKDYGITILKLCIADAGDSINDANFSIRNVEPYTKHLYSYIKWYEINKELYKAFWHEPVFTGFINNDVDALFLNKLIHYYKLAVGAYEAMKFKEALKHVFYHMTNAKELYGHMCHMMGYRYNNNLIALFMNMQARLLYPIIPNISMYFFNNIFEHGLHAYQKLIDDMVSTFVIDTASIDADVMIEELISKIRNMTHKAAKRSLRVSSVNVRVSPSRLPQFDRFKQYIAKQTNATITLECDDTYGDDKFTFRISDT